MHYLDPRGNALFGAVAFVLFAGASVGAVIADVSDNPMVLPAETKPDNGHAEFVAADYLLPVPDESQTAASVPPGGITAPEGCAWVADAQGNPTLFCAESVAAITSPQLSANSSAPTSDLPPILTREGCVRVNDAAGKPTLLCPESGAHTITLQLPTEPWKPTSNRPPTLTPEGCAWVSDGTGEMMLYCPEPVGSGTTQPWAPPVLPSIQKPSGCWWVTNGSGLVLLFCPPTEADPVVPTIPPLRSTPDACVWITDGRGHLELLCLPTAVVPSPELNWPPTSGSARPPAVGPGVAGAQHVPARESHATSGSSAPMVGAALVALAAGGLGLRRRIRLSAAGESAEVCD